MVDTVMQAFDKHEIKVVDSAFALNKTGHRIVGGFEVVGDCLPTTNVDGNFQLFTGGGNDFSKSQEFNGGMNLFACTNGMMTGDQLAKHRHTAKLEFETWSVDEVVPSFIDKCTDINYSVDKMREYELSDAEAYRLILESADSRIMPYARAIDVYREWQNPTFADDDFQKNTMWKLYNDFTYVAQKCKPERQHQIIREMHRELISEC